MEYVLSRLYINIKLIESVLICIFFSQFVIHVSSSSNSNYLSFQITIAETRSKTADWLYKPASANTTITKDSAVIPVQNTNAFIHKTRGFSII